MVDPIRLVKSLDTAPCTPCPKLNRLKPRQLRRKEERDRLKAMKSNKK
jgi:hypothetical protein